MPLPALLLGAAMLAAPAISTDRACYVSGNDTIAITGSGFAVNGPITLSFTGNDKVLTSDASADATGVLDTQVDTPSLADFGADSSGIPVAVDTADGAAAGFDLVDWTGTLSGYGKSIRRGQRITVDTSGWIGATTLYLHYVRGGRTVRSQRIGTTTGACGDLTKRLRAFTFRGARPGNYVLRVSPNATFDGRDRWLGFGRVKLTS